MKHEHAYPSRRQLSNRQSATRSRLLRQQREAKTIALLRVKEAAMDELAARWPTISVGLAYAIRAGAVTAADADRVTELVLGPAAPAYRPAEMCGSHEECVLLEATRFIPMGATNI
jgi:hypothetical protein